MPFFPTDFQPEDVFETFDPEPLGTASLAQVFQRNFHELITPALTLRMYPFLRLGTQSHPKKWPKGRSQSAASLCERQLKGRHENHGISVQNHVLGISRF